MDISAITIKEISSPADQADSTDYHIPQNQYNLWETIKDQILFLTIYFPFFQNKLVSTCRNDY